MSSSLYYLLPQLPYLVYGQEPPMPRADFRELARPLLSEEDVALFDQLSLDPQPISQDEEESGFSYTEPSPPSGSDFIDGWREWERSFRLNLAKLRSVKLKREDAAMEAPGTPLDAVVAAARAMQEAPLDAEILIDKARWSAIDNLQGTAYFDRDKIFAYFLKLMILERCALFSAENGFSEYNSLYTSILESTQTGESPAGEYT